MSRILTGVSPLSDGQQNALAAILYKHLPREPYLLHGTMLGSKALRTNTLLHADWANECVSLTRSAHVAAKYANSFRDFDDGFGTVFVLDRASLRQRYKIELWNDLADSEDRYSLKYEMEERIFQRDLRPLHLFTSKVIFVVLGTVLTIDGWQPAAVFARDLAWTFRELRRLSGASRRKRGRLSGKMALKALTTLLPSSCYLVLDE